MDLSELDLAAAADRGSELTLLHPGTGESGDAVLHVLGYDSEAVLNAGRAIEREAMATAKKVDLADIQEKTRIAKAIAAVVSVDGMTFNGKAVTRDRLAEAMRQPGYSWIVDQIQRHGADRANLFPKPPAD